MTSTPIEPDRPGPGARLGGYRLLEPLPNAPHLYRAVLEGNFDPSSPPGSRHHIYYVARPLRSPLFADRQASRPLWLALKTWAKTRHLNVCSLVGLASEADRLWIVTDLVTGPSLPRLAADRPLPTTALLDLADQAARGLAAAQEAGVVHGWFCPPAVHVGKDAWPAQVRGFEWAPLSRAAAYSGKDSPALRYAAPEVVSGAAPDAAADVYSFGRVFEEAIERSRVDAPARHDELRDLVARCLEPQRDRRWPDAKAVATALAALRRSTAG